VLQSVTEYKVMIVKITMGTATAQAVIKTVQVQVAGNCSSEVCS